LDLGEVIIRWEGAYMVSLVENSVSLNKLPGPIVCRKKEGEKMKEKESELKKEKHDAHKNESCLLNQA
jgi:hypothetical protein